MDSTQVQDDPMVKMEGFEAFEGAPCEDAVMNSSAEAAEHQPQQQEKQGQQAVPEQSAAEQTAAAGATAEAVAAAAAAAEAASGAVGDGDEAMQQLDHPAQLSYAAIREAEAVNQAADSAADEAMRTVAAAQQTMHLLMNPVQPTMSQQHDGMPMEDDAGNSTHPPSGRARRNRSSTGYMDHQAHMMGMGHGHGMYGGGRPNKGLRHFSMKVCEKIESKGTTSYSEVADELVAELKDGGLDDGIFYDENNIRRRVYDAINVLMALDIIAKEKKAIIWKGFPSNSLSPAQQVQRLQTEQQNAMLEVGRKAQYLADLVGQQKALKHLLDRNKAQPDAVNSGARPLHLPVILVQKKADATVDVQLSENMTDPQFYFYSLNLFQSPFDIYQYIHMVSYDDVRVLRMMLEHDTQQPTDPYGLGDAMAIDSAMLTAEQQMQLMQQQQDAMAALAMEAAAMEAAAAAAAAAAGHC